MPDSLINPLTGAWIHDPVTGAVQVSITGNIASPGAVTGSLNNASPGVIAAAGDYADNDVVSDSVSNGTGHAWVFAGMANAGGGSGEIVGAQLVCSVAALTSTFRLWLFDALPSASELDDNSAFNLAAGDQSKLVGWIDFPAAASAGGAAVANAGSISLPYSCASAATSLWGILQATDPITNEVASMTIGIKLFVKRG